MSEEFLTCKEQTSAFEYVITQRKPSGELGLRIGNQLLQKIFPSQKHFSQLVEYYSTPDKFMSWLAHNCQVSYYEPLSLWTMQLGELPSKHAEVSPFVDEWKPKSYQTTFMMTAKTGQEVGVATLEYTPPHSKTIRQEMSDLDFDVEEGETPDVSVETKK